MNKDQFIYWLKGFTRAVNEEGPTRGQWGIIASELNKIEDCTDFGSKIDEPYKFDKSWTATSTAYKANLPKDNNQLELDLN
jgi:hypothetical protein